MGRTHWTPIQLRFGDTDALGHVNNASFASYAELGRLDFLDALGGFVGSLILANLTIDFRRQVSLGETLGIETWVVGVGRSSVTLGQTVWVDSSNRDGDRERAADIRSVVVYFDYAAARSKRSATRCARPWSRIAGAPSRSELHVDKSTADSVSERRMDKSTDEDVAFLGLRRDVSPGGHSGSVWSGPQGLRMERTTGAPYG